MSISAQRKSSIGGEKEGEGGTLYFSVHWLVAPTSYSFFCNPTGTKDREDKKMLISIILSMKRREYVYSTFLQQTSIVI
jgi:hypothetical protein